MCVISTRMASPMQLQAQLPLLQALFAEEKNQSEFSINDIIKSLSQLSSVQRLAFSNILVMPATNASSERSLRVTKNKDHLRTTMTEEVK